MVGLIALVVFGIYIGIALFCIKKVKGKKQKIFVSLIFILIPTADVIAGQIYFSYLCNTEAGQFVYKTVEVGDDYFLKTGEIDESRRGVYPDTYAIAKGGEINIRKIREKFDMPIGAEKSHLSDLFHITQWKYYIKIKNTDELLSESIAFNYKGGWVENIYNMSSGKLCPSRGLFNSKSLMQATFKLKK